MIKITAPKDRAVSLTSTEGVSIHIKAGQSALAQPFLAQAAAVAGCAFVYIDDEVPETSVLAKVDRTEDLMAAVRQLTKAGDPANFTTTGRPRKSAVQALVDFDFTGAELAQAFDDSLENPS